MTVLAFCIWIIFFIFIFQCLRTRIEILNSHIFNLQKLRPRCVQRLEVKVGSKYSMFIQNINRTGNMMQTNGYEIDFLSRQAILLLCIYLYMCVFYLSKSDFFKEISRTHKILQEEKNVPGKFSQNFV